MDIIKIINILIDLNLINLKKALFNEIRDYRLSHVIYHVFIRKLINKKII